MAQCDNDELVPVLDYETSDRDNQVWMLVKNERTNDEDEA